MHKIFYLSISIIVTFSTFLVYNVHLHIQSVFIFSLLLPFRTLWVSFHKKIVTRHTIVLDLQHFKPHWNRGWDVLPCCDDSFRKLNLTGRLDYIHIYLCWPSNGAAGVWFDMFLCCLFHYVACNHHSGLSFISAKAQHLIQLSELTMLGSTAIFYSVWVYRRHLLWHSPL